MSVSRNSTRQRLINAALELFSVQGVTETTTKQIAELAEVNEVTLFRQFGNKHSLLLAVIEEAAVFSDLGQSLVQQSSPSSSMEQVLKTYATAYLQSLESVPEVVRSVIGEAGHYPPENRKALGQGLTQVNRTVAEYLATVMHNLPAHLSAEQLASLLNAMLLGYAVIEFTSEFHQLWRDRNDFLDNMVTLFVQDSVQGSIAPASGFEPDSDNPIQLAMLAHASEQGSEVVTEPVADLPASLVYALLRRSRKVGLQEYAILYVLFGAGLSAVELVRLERAHYISDDRQQLLQITQGNIRQVPINQWIMGKRYGSHTRNPLSQWLKSRKDNQPALFLNETGHPLSETDLQQQWQALTAEFLAPSGQPPTLGQAQQTWCIDMLMRGIDLEDLCILTGWTTAKLQPYARRAREKTALEQASRLDQKA